MTTVASCLPGIGVPPTTRPRPATSRTDRWGGPAPSPRRVGAATTAGSLRLALDEEADAPARHDGVRAGVDGDADAEPPLRQDGGELRLGHRSRVRERPAAARRPEDLVH